MKYIEEPWTIIESYFEGQYLERLVRHQIESYNDFVSHKMRTTIEMFNPMRIVSQNDYNSEGDFYSLELYVTFKNLSMLRPQLHENNGATKTLYPQEARLRNFTYASTILCDVEIKVDRKYSVDDIHSQVKTIPKVQIGKIPIMLKSIACVLKQQKSVNYDEVCECRYDPGGYFIINGSEKTVLAQERAAENKVYVRKAKPGSKWLCTAEIKSIPDFKIISPKQIMMMISSKNNGFGHPIYIRIQRIKQDIPLFVLFRVLGVISDKDIITKILLEIEDKNKLFALRASVEWMRRHIQRRMKLLNF